MSTDAATSAFFVSLQSVAQVLSIIVVGAAATSKGLLPASTRKAFANMAMRVRDCTPN